MEKQQGFSRVEIICVAVIAFLALSVIHAGANLSREHARRMVCANNVRVNAEAIVGYALDNSNTTPYWYMDGLWLHDIGTRYFNCIKGYGANPYTLFCPSDIGYNFYKSPDSTYWTQYADWGWYISSYFWMTRNTSTQPNDKRWVKTIDVLSPQTTELLTDVQFSDGLEPDSNYAYVIGGGSYVDYTNHRQGAKSCAGGNIGFIDLHVEWRPFAEMEFRLEAVGGSPNPYQWW